MNAMIYQIRTELKNHSDEKTREGAQRFFKEKIKLYGIKTATTTQIGKKYYNLIKNKKKTEIFSLCEELWKSGYIEESFIACHWSYIIHKKYEKDDLQLFEKWISQYVTNWASCDTFCNHTVGEFIEMFPEKIDVLKQWTSSKNRWMKRAVAVSLIIPARHGKFLKDIFEIADLLLTDTDDMVQKGYGWMLKAASQAHETEVFNYVMQNKKAMPRTALRYAVEKMPKNLKEKAMEK